MNGLMFVTLLLLVGQAFSYRWQLPLVSNVFGSNMVLQREPQSAKIWGWANDSAVVTLLLYDSAMGKEAYTSATDQDGKWSVTLNPKAAGGPYSILVKSSSTVANLTNVLFGDVYYCSGQSNMEYSLGTAFNGTTAATASNNAVYSNIRLLRVPTVDAPVDYDMYTPDPIVNDTLSWAVASRTVTISFSAVCWWNAMHMASALNYSIPIGLIGNYWGGTKIEKWMSPQLFDSSATGCPSGQSSTEPSAIYNTMVFPFLPMAFRVMYWYQGESNVGANNYYRCVFPQFVADYRAKFESNFTFVFVQLAPNNETDSDRPDFRAMQFDSYVNSISDSCLVSTTELGDLDSPRTPRHPRIKEPVGYRAHLCTRKLVYGMQGIWNGPIPTCATLNNDEITMSFAQGTVGSGLVLREHTCPYSDERRDTLCGRSWEISDGTSWHNATYYLSDDRMQLILKGSFVFPSNASLLQLRYGYGEYPVATLFNSEGVAAPTFVVGLSSCPTEPTSGPVVGTVPQSASSPISVPEESTPRVPQTNACHSPITRVLAMIVANIMILQIV